MAQQKVWEKEYHRPQLVTKQEKPQNFLVQYIKYLKKAKQQTTNDLKVLDLGCGTGRNSNYLAMKGNEVIGIDLAQNAINLAKQRAEKLRLDNVKYLQQSIGTTLPFPDHTFDLILDITSSNSLNQKEREVYLKESHRVLKPGGLMIIRALCKDGDRNAQKLLKLSPGKEPDTYYLKELRLTERVFSEQDFRAIYEPYYIIDKLDKDIGYPKLNGQVYIRKYWQAILEKKSYL